MPTICQIRGMLLEEVLLYLLKTSGYRTVEKTADDPTLQDGPSGLEVKGRGGQHQIDAVADFLVAQPFSHPQRLLVEAKCYSKNPVGIEIVRNAVGVNKDVSEYWITRGHNHEYIPTKRYHYQYAIFSTSGYSREAERYAFAQDIYLIPLAKSSYFIPVLEAIRSFCKEDFQRPNREDNKINMHDLRQSVRYKLRSDSHTISFIQNSPEMESKLDTLTESCSHIGKALLAVIGGRFPVFLVPNPALTEYNYISGPDPYHIKICYDADHWYIQNMGNENLFSFELPPELFLLYAKEGMLTPIQAIKLKEVEMDEIQAIHSVDESLRLIRFSLDHGWLEEIKTKLEEKQHSSRG